MSALTTKFEKAAKDVQQLSQKPGNDVLLNLYALYKQGTEGDVRGKRPGMMDFKGRAKFDAWAKLKSTSKEKAMEGYIALVESLL
jgi:diazepam-binding inhibitor (GABA receptor modulating acyl-CoA-binding protein)